jgi:uncharacterized flavoprotein (TIGR03862 family)
MSDSICIIGAGPTGLFCSYLLLNAGINVQLFDQMSGVGKKFLVAGYGGLNLTHREDIDIFASRYGKDRDFFFKLINEFSNQDLINWCHQLGVETFIGSSGRVFPKKMNAAEILLKWKEQLQNHSDFQLFTGHRLINFSSSGELIFESNEKTLKVKAKKTIIALGGASWKKTGSDGKWTDLFQEKGIAVSPFSPSNCGYQCNWSDKFKEKADHTPLKNIALRCADHQVKGELMLTPYGVEGGTVYALGAIIRQEIADKGKVKVYVDFKPGLDRDELLKKLEKRSKKTSLSNFLRKSLKLDSIVSTCLRENFTPEQLAAPETLVEAIKSFAIEVNSPRPIDEAISTAGGVLFSELSENLELKKYPGIFIGGEMLDFDAPTGGYLLQACFSTAYRISQTIINARS